MTQKLCRTFFRNNIQVFFSNPSSSKKKIPNIKCNLNTTLEDIDFTTEDIENAIGEINDNSACGEGDIPALILKKCKSTLSYPILLIWKDSLRTGYVPKIYKRQIINPVHKKFKQGSWDVSK